MSLVEWYVVIGILVAAADFSFDAVARTVNWLDALLVSVLMGVFWPFIAATLVTTAVAMHFQPYRCDRVDDRLVAHSAMFVGIVSLLILAWVFAGKLVR